MDTTYDLVLRHGLIVDGTGGEMFVGDVAIDGGHIVAVESSLKLRGREEIDAAGKIVTPGFVDIHTHYDGQATWDSRLAPSSVHGVTTVIIGNCGVGFAPCRAEEHALMIKLMDGVEDIPGVVLTEGVPWEWESFPQYLDFLEKRRFDVDIGAYIPHAALRVYVMGERGFNCEAATGGDLAAMAALVGEAVEAGAFGFGTSRILFHQTRDGKPIPTLKSSRAELEALAQAMGTAGKGIIQYVGHFTDPDIEFEELCALVQQSGRPLTVPVSANQGRLLELLSKAVANGLPISGQVLPRPIGFLLSYELTLNPFYATAPYQALSALSFTEKVAHLRTSKVRAAILAAVAEPLANSLGSMVRDFEHMFVLGDPPNYEPDSRTSLVAESARRGCTAQELAYDLMLEKDGRNILYCAVANYDTGTLDPHLAAFQRPGIVAGLGDGGAHVGTLCDASYTTFMLSHMVRDRKGGKLPLQAAVKYLSSDPAGVMGLNDRGRISPGLRADINIIDLDKLKLHAPRLVHDLPAGGARLLQTASGYTATIVAGEVTYLEGVPTGALPGRLVRGAQCAPATA